jgi:hypothetical protein
VACWYLSTLSRESALLHMREGLVRFTGHHGRQGYHETLTRFWLVLLEEFLGPLGEIETLVERTNHALEHYANKEIVFDYYSRERVLSQAARERWVEPDRMSLRQPSGQAP